MKIEIIKPCLGSILLIFPGPTDFIDFLAKLSEVLYENVNAEETTEINFCIWGLPPVIMAFPPATDPRLIMLADLEFNWIYTTFYPSGEIKLLVNKQGFEKIRPCLE